MRRDGFDRVLGVDVTGRRLDVEGLATYETIVDATLRQGLLPTVTPEPKRITLGGATVGIGIESTCVRHGFVDKGLLRAVVLLPHGDVVLCDPKGPHADLCAALPNSYGTLGYILRAEIDLDSSQALRAPREPKIRHSGRVSRSHACRIGKCGR